MRMRFGKVVCGDMTNNNASSAKRHNLCVVEAISRPRTSGFALIKAAKGSITRANNRGDRGQPCLVPREMGKGSERNPEYCTYACGWLYKALIQPRKCGPKPQRWRI